MCHKKNTTTKKIASEERQKKKETECILCLQGFLGFLFHQRAYILVKNLFQAEKFIKSWNGEVKILNIILLALQLLRTDYGFSPLTATHFVVN